MTPRETVSWILLGVAALLGLLIGSLLNLCITRLPRGVKLFRGVLDCPECSRRKRWIELLPLVGWLRFREPCFACGSARVPTVELLSATLFFVSAWDPVLAGEGVLSLSQRAVLFVLHAWIACVMIASTFINLEHGILPDELTLTGILIAIGCSWAFPFPPDRRLFPGQWIGGPLTVLAGAAIGGAVPLIVRLFGNARMGRETLGLGAVKYSAMLGSVLGPMDAWLAFLAACLLASILGLVKKALTGRMGNAEFGPLQSLGAFPFVFWSTQMHGLLDRLMSLYRHGVSHVL